MKEFYIKFSLSDSEFFTALRLAAGAIASVEEKDIDTLEDFKVCVTESALILKNCGFGEVGVTFKDNSSGVVCELAGLGGSPKAGENDLSLALVSALMEECSISRRGDIIERVTLKI